MARAGLSFNSGNGNFHTEFEGSEAFCSGAIKCSIAAAFSGNAPAGAVRTSGDSLPGAAPAEQPPIYDVTLKDGEEIQVMEIG